MHILESSRRVGGTTRVVERSDSRLKRYYETAFGMDKFSAAENPTMLAVVNYYSGGNPGNLVFLVRLGFSVRL